MNELKKTNQYETWFTGLRDQHAKQRIALRVRRAEGGNFGDYRSVGEGVSEMRIDYGPGYRVYYAQEGTTVYLLLLGGDKRTQDNDIAHAKAIWKAAKEKK